MSGKYESTNRSGDCVRCNTVTSALLVLFAYLLGSVPFAQIAGRTLRGVDIRTLGDGNAGAANVYRHIGHNAGIAVMLADAGKGFLPVLLALNLDSQAVSLLCGAAAVAGHNWPVFSGFKGGRGQATATGVLIALLPRTMGILFLAAFVPFLLTRNTMVASAILFAPLWLVAWLTGAPSLLVAYSIALPCLVGATHFLSTRGLSEEAKREAVYMR